jgi:hypothetical protein
LFNPLVRGGFTSGFVVGSGLDVGVGWVNAISLDLDVLGLRGVEIAPVSVVGQDGDIFPRARVPIRIVVSFFGTFVSVSVSVIVLSGVDSRSSSSGQTSLSSSIGDVKTHVSFSGLAVLVESIVLVHSVQQTVGTLSSGSSGIIGDGVGGLSVSY